jgi:hypothetical protein
MTISGEPGELCSPILYIVNMKRKSHSSVIIGIIIIIIIIIIG